MGVYSGCEAFDSVEFELMSWTVSFCLNKVASYGVASESVEFEAGEFAGSLARSKVSVWGRLIFFRDLFVFGKHPV